MSSPYKSIGLIFMATGILHTGLGILLFGSQLEAIYSAGLVNGIDKHFDRGFAFWFVFAGLLMITVGYLMDWVVRKKHLLLPRSFGYLLIVICLIGVVVMPVGGFWLVFLQGVYIVAKGEKEQSNAQFNS